MSAGLIGRSGAGRQGLVPLLHKRGLPLLELPTGNFELSTHERLLVRGSYRRWPERDLDGNTIDFFVKAPGSGLSSLVGGLSCRENSPSAEGFWRRRRLAYEQLSTRHRTL